MGILANISDRPPEKVRRCRFSEWLETLDDEDREAVDTMLADERWSIENLVTVFAESGCPVSYSRIRVHRLDLCEPCKERETK